MAFNNVGYKQAKSNLIKKFMLLQRHKFLNSSTTTASNYFKIIKSKYKKIALQKVLQKIKVKEFLKRSK